jgi:PAS domain S-box-containing protein
VAELSKPAAWKSYLVGLATIAAALVARLALDPYLGNQLPYVTFFVAVTVVAWYEELGPTLVAIIAGACVSNYFFVNPRHSFAIAGIASQVGFGTYFMVTVPIAFLANRQKRDATAHAKAEERLARQEALRESEGQFRTLANAIPQLCWMAEVDGSIFWYNERWYEYTGTTPEQMEGWGWKSVHDPDSLPKVLERWQNSIATSDPFDMVFPLRGADGALRPFLTRVMPVRDAEGKVIRWFGTNTDISEQKQIEAELRTSKERLDLALEVASVGEWELDLKLHIGSRSKRHAEIFGDSFSALNWSFESFIEHVVPEHRAEVAEKIKASLVSGIWDFETQIRRADGQIRWIWARGCSVLDETVKPTRMYGTVMDITERKQAESALQITLHRLYVILSNMYAGVLLVTDEGRVEFANQAFCDRFGLTDAPADLVGCEPGVMIEKIKNAYRHPDEAVTRIREILDRGEPVMGEELAMRGGKTYLRDFAPLCVDGISFGRLWLHTDISGRKKVEEELREREALLRSVAENSRVGLVMLSAERHYLYANSAYAEVLGLGTMDIVGKQVPDVMSHVYDQISPRLDKAFAGERVSYELKVPVQPGTGDEGHDRFFAITYEPLQGHDEGSRIIAVVVDITERKVAEIELEATRLQAERTAAQLRTILDNMEERLYVCDPDGTMIVANEAARKTYGTDKKAVAPSVFDMEDLIEVSALDGRPLLKSEWPISRVLRGEHVHSAEIRVRFKETGTEHILTSNGAPIRDRNGSIVMAVLTSGDITERKRIEHQIRDLNQQLEDRVRRRTAELEAANKELEAFSYSVSHDLRAPLRAINGFSQAVMEDYGSSLPAEGQEYLGTICRGATRMGELIDDLLAFSRLSRQPLSLSPVDTHNLVRQCLEDLESTHKDRVIEFSVGELPFCLGDRSLLKQVWTNLLSNAIKFTGDRQCATVQIGAQFVPGKVVYFIKDNGAGFDMKYANKLFGVFQRLHRNDEFEGTGVGLAIVQRIVHRHGGRVWADAVLDQGATFYFTLPEKGTRIYE